jgi:hypothetical protein
MVFFHVGLVLPTVGIVVGFEVLAATVMNVAFFWDIAPCSPYVTDVPEERITSIIRVENQPS